MRDRKRRGGGQGGKKLCGMFQSRGKRTPRRRTLRTMCVRMLRSCAPTKHRSITIVETIRLLNYAPSKAYARCFRIKDDLCRICFHRPRRRRMWTWCRQPQRRLSCGREYPPISAGRDSPAKRCRFQMQTAILWLIQLQLPK